SGASPRARNVRLPLVSGLVYLARAGSDARDTLGDGARLSADAAVAGGSPREALPLSLRLGEAAPPATTTRHPPAVRRAARLGQPPAVCHVGEGSPHGVKN